jgi:hypothetical protein
MGTDTQTEKYKALYELSKEVLKEDDDRNKLIEDKAAKYFPGLVVMFGGYGFFAKWTIDTLFPLHSILDVIFLIDLTLITFLLLISSYLIFAILNQREFLVRPIDIDLFDNEELDAIYRALSELNRSMLLKNRCNTNNKSNLLWWVHWLIVVAIILFSALLPLYYIHSVEQRSVKSDNQKEIGMSKEKDKNPPFSDVSIEDVGKPGMQEEKDKNVQQGQTNGEPNPKAGIPWTKTDPQKPDKLMKNEADERKEEGK